MNVWLKEDEVIELFAPKPLIKEAISLSKRYGIWRGNVLIKGMRVMLTLIPSNGAFLTITRKYATRKNAYSRDEFVTLVEDLIRQNIQGALLLIDLDYFKQVNDVFGHSIGDVIINEIENRISQKSFFYCRHAGDEFFVVLVGKNLHEKAEDLLIYLSNPMSIQGIELQITASAGMSCFPQQGRTFKKLYSLSDLALYQAKQSGRGKLVLAERSREPERFYHPKKHHLFFYPMPILDRNLKIYAYELLARLNDTVTNETIHASRFITTWHATGIIRYLDIQLIDHVNHLLKTTSDTYAINLSSPSLHDKSIINKVIHLARNFGPRLIVEISERTDLLNRDSHILEICRTLKKYNSCIAIDDFGSGTTSLWTISLLEANIIKIDGHFVSQLPKNRAIIEGLITMAHRSNIIVIAEHVETKEQMDLLLELRVDGLQGTYPSKLHERSSSESPRKPGLTEEES